jgi:hypothetical protein
VIELEHEVARWQRELLLWVASQTRYVASLLDWVRLCHLDEEPAEQRKRRSLLSPAPIIPRSVRRSSPMFALASSWDESLVWLGKNADASSEALKAFADALHALQSAEADELRLEAGGLATAVDAATAAEAGDDPTFSILAKHLCPVFESLYSFASIAVEEYGKLYQDAKLSGRVVRKGTP